MNTKKRGADNWGVNERREKRKNEEWSKVKEGNEDKALAVMQREYLAYTNKQLNIQYVPHKMTQHCESKLKQIADNEE